MLANLCFSLSLARDFLTNFNGSVRQNFQCYVKKQIEKKNLWSVLLSTIEMTGVKGSKLKNTDHEKLLSICLL